MMHILPVVPATFSFLKKILRGSAAACPDAVWRGGRAVRPSAPLIAANVRGRIDYS